MIFGSVAVADAGGATLAHSLIVGGERWSKGRILTPEDLAAAAAAGIAELTVARADPGDVAEDAAAAEIGARLAGDGVVAMRAAHGRVNLAAAHAGVIILDAAAVAAVNAVDEGVTLATLAPFARVAAGEIIATIKIIPYAVTRAHLEAACAAATPLAVAGFALQRFALLQTTLPGSTAKALARTLAVTRARVEALSSTLDDGGSGPHDTAGLAARLAACRADIVLIAGASATADRRDVIPAAIIAAGGHIERLGMPVDPGNLLCLGRIDGRPVIGLPGCARSPKRNGFDWVLERLAAGLSVDDRAIAAMGVGGLLAEAERPQPRAANVSAPGPVGAVVLAAGRSTRMGAAHKLLADLNGKPLVAHVIDALAEAGLPPPVVVLGHEAAAVRAAIEPRPATFITAPDYADGLGRSLAVGIAAAPPEWSAALICLGDMPRVGVATLRALASAAGAAAHDVALPVWNGKRGNPVRWPRAWFARLATLTGDVGGKALLGEVGDTLVEVAAADDGVLMDVDTPEALAALQREQTARQSRSGAPRGK